MKWYQKTWFWVILLAALCAAAAFALAMVGKVDGKDALAFIGTGVLGAVFGFLAGKMQGEAKVLVPFVVAAALLASACTTTDTGQKKFDTCKAMRIASQSHAVAAGASGIVCALLPTRAERAKCEAERAKYDAAAKAVLSIGGAILKACGL
jgi:hypothetical protein